MKTCLITGGARGMGAVTALELAQRGFHVVIADWDGEAGQRTRRSINAAVGEARCDFVYCDVSDLDAVRQLAAHVLERYPRLDVLVNNAGLVDPVRRLSEQGHEMHFATMHLGHFLLARLLLDRLRESAPARIVIIASDGHKACKGLDFDDLENERLWSRDKPSGGAAFHSYARAKLCNLYFMQELHRRLAGSGVTVNAVSPGYFVNTTIYRNLTGVARWGCRLVFGLGTLLRMNSAEQGARTHIWLASSPEAAQVSGEYLEKCRPKAMSPQAGDAEAAARLWTVSETLCGLEPA